MNRARPSTLSAEELQRRLAAASLPLPAPRMPAVGLRTRLQTSPMTRGLLPARLALRRAQARGQAIWDSGTEVQEDAEQAIRTIVGETKYSLSVFEMARLFVVEREIGQALFWRPWHPPALDHGSEHRLRSALANRRGVFLSTCHYGPFFSTSTAVVAIGGKPPCAIGGQWFFEDPTPDLWGRRLARWRRGLHPYGIRVTPARGAYQVLRALLQRGETIINYFDMPGKHETSFLGKPTMLADGTARLACEAEALVVPMHARRVGMRIWVDIGDTLDPRDFADVAELHAAIAAAHTERILRAPWALEDPRRPGAWETGATASAWALPPRGQVST
jgi:lauroyl/myristoyl acyltransferase